MAHRANKLGANQPPAGQLPRRFPVGTKFVIEARNSSDGPIYSRHLEFPDGTHVALPPRRSAPAAARRGRAKAGRAKNR
jgi:hypothetical protein